MARMRTTSPPCSTSKASRSAPASTARIRCCNGFGVAATCRASLAFYNTHDEIERFVAALRKVRMLLM